MKEAPINFTATWSQGGISMGEVYTRKIVSGYPLGSTYHRERYLRDEEHQLPERAFQDLWAFAIGLCALKPDYVVSFLRDDKEDETEETDNNRPFIMESSPRYFPGAEVKDIRYEGTIYHSDPSQVRKFEGRDSQEVVGAVTPSQPHLSRKERKHKRHR